MRNYNAHIMSLLIQRHSPNDCRGPSTYESLEARVSEPGKVYLDVNIFKESELLTSFFETLLLYHWKRMDKPVQGPF